MISAKKPAPAQPSLRMHSDMAYVIQACTPDGIVKIGRSSNPRTRVRGLVSGVPFEAGLVAVLNEGSKREREIKALMAPFKIRGEWFKPAPALNEYLADCAKQSAVLHFVPKIEDRFEHYFKPLILDYLNGRTPTLTEGGDLVTRLLREGFPALGNRAQRLIAVCPHVITPEMVAGFVPLPVGEPVPAIRIVDPAPEPAPADADRAA